MHGTQQCREWEDSHSQKQTVRDLANAYQKSLPENRQSVLMAHRNSSHTEEHGSIFSTTWRRLAQISALFQTQVQICETPVWGQVLLCGLGYLGPALFLSLWSTPHLALKLILISIVWKRMALFSRLGRGGARLRPDIQNSWRNSSFESIVMVSEGQVFSSDAKQNTQQPCWPTTEVAVSGETDAEAAKSSSSFCYLALGWEGLHWIYPVQKQPGWEGRGGSWS